MNKKREKNMIYHYCGMEPFFNIFKYKKIWLSDVTKMNDSNEMNILLTGFKESILNEFDNQPFELNDVFIDQKVSFNESQTRNCIQSFYEKHMYNYFYSNENKFTAFLICFCKHPDILSQWYMYADQARGVAIGFDKRDINDFVSKNSGYEFVEIKYITEDEKKVLQKKFAVEILDIFREKIPQNMKRIKKIHIQYNIVWDNEQFFEQLFYNLEELCFIKLMKESLRYKSKDFAHEQEYRLIYKPQSTYYNDPPRTDDEKKEYELIDYRLSNGMLVKYIDIKLEDICSFARTIILGDGSLNTEETIERALPKDIVLGPKNTNSIHEIMQFMTKKGFAYYPRRSDISYK